MSTISGEDGPCALLLAGGESRRLGGVPKATLSVGDEAAIVRMARIAAAEGFAPAVVVAGRHYEQTVKALHGRSIPVVENREWASGRTGSIRLGLDTLPTQQDVLLWPVDHPLVEAKTLRVLRSVAEGDPMALWLLPTYERRGGHPVYLRAPVRPMVQFLAPDAPLRALLRRLGPQVRRVPVTDPGVTSSVETFEDYHAALANWRARGSP
ncbi:MAG: NTP transferase domain-containing protein [Thermoplasmata archaeon]|nr:NTP transferase domain-containing protein [Thermoplasmata archaeon]